MKPKLVLFDVFSYSCMNCLRSLDFIKKISNKYKKFGLKTVIIHPPEWEFEKNNSNIRLASKKYGVNFPIKIDRNCRIIKKYGVNFWPAQILVKNNQTVYKHTGEGNYGGLEKSIIKNLKINSKRLFNNEPKYSKFPAIYCGKRKKGRISGLNKKLKFGIVYNDGNWVQKDEYLQSVSDDSSLTILTKGKIINFVAKAINNKPIKIKIVLNNKLIKQLMVSEPGLYRIIRSKNNEQKMLTIITQKNLAAYSFSFQ
ncbi:MAG: redoxin family protein [Nanoarchaeota archaeon]